MGSKTGQRPGELSRRRVSRSARDRKLRTWLLSATAGVAVMLFGLLGYGIVEKYWIIPQKNVATVGEHEISLELLQQHTRYRRSQMLNQYISYLDVLQYAGEQRNQVQDLLDQIDTELKNPVVLTRSIMDELVNMYLILDESRTRNMIITEDEIETAIKMFFGYDSSATDLSSSIRETDDIISATKSANIQSPTATPYTMDAYRENYKNYMDEIEVDTGMSENTFRSLFASKLRTEKLRGVIVQEQDYPEEEQVHVKHILLSLDNLDAASSILARALEGEDFDELAMQFSDDESNANIGGDLGWIARGQMVNSFEQVIFEAEKGVVGELVATQFGLHIVKIVERQVRSLPSSIVEQRRMLAFNEWLLGMRSTTNIDVLDWWEPHAPTNPTLQDMYDKIAESK
ncbi:MAG: peptidylprolyl isomerase [Chloroflexota bacterium]|nr:peptidylprolyl isomerase [Chloroflexota bacterium]